jgi:hypothetical protein
MTVRPVPKEVSECMEDLLQRLESTPMVKITTAPDIVEMLPPRPVEEEAVPPELKRYRELLAAPRSSRIKSPVRQAKKRKYRLEDGKLIIIDL